MSQTAVQHYRIVPAFPIPQGSSTGLAALIQAAHDTIQNSVDLLGGDDPPEPPDLLGLLHDDGLVDDQNHSAAATEYTNKVDDINAFAKKMRDNDHGVTSTTSDTSGVALDTWHDINRIVGDLIKTLGPGAPKPVADPQHPGVVHLSATAEQSLVSAVLSAVGKVHDDVEGAVEKIRQQANTIYSAQPTTYSSNGTGGNGSTAAPAMPLVPVDGSGGYNPRYTQALTSRVSSTAHHILSTSQLEYYIGKALDALGITDPTARANWTRGYLVLIQRESSGDVGSINLTDSNAKAGHPSEGLTQTIPETFQAYHVAGTSNDITDPTANIAASMNYVMHRYSVSRDGANLASNVQQADPSRPAKGY